MLPRQQTSPVSQLAALEHVSEIAAFVHWPVGAQKMPPDPKQQSCVSGSHVAGPHAIMPGGAVPKPPWEAPPLELLLEVAMAPLELPAGTPELPDTGPPDPLELTPPPVPVLAPLPELELTLPPVPVLAPLPEADGRPVEPPTPPLDPVPGPDVAEGPSPIPGVEGEIPTSRLVREPQANMKKVETLNRLTT